MVTMASVIVPWRVGRTTTTTQYGAIRLRMQCLLTIRSTSAYIVDFGHSCYDQLTAVKAMHSLTSITFTILYGQCRAHRGQMIFFSS